VRADPLARLFQFLFRVLIPHPVGMQAIPLQIHLPIF